MDNEERVKFLDRVAMIAAPAILEECFKVAQGKYRCEGYNAMQRAAQLSYTFAEHMWTESNIRKESE